MKTNDARYILRRLLVVRDVVSSHPIFVAPDITQQDEHEACQIKNEFLNWNRSAHRRDVAAECGRLVWKNEERIAEEQIEQEAERCEDRDRSPKCFPGKDQIRPASKPACERSNGNSEQRQAPSVSERRRIIRSGLQN